MMMVAFSVSNDQTPASVDVWGTMRAVLPSGGRIIPKGFSIAVYVPVRGGTKKERAIDQESDRRYDHAI